MTPLLLSKRQAAKLLGIGRDLLGELIAAGHVKLVNVLDHEPRIAREELERFAREGTGPQIRASSPPKRDRVPLSELRKEF